jgi:hypothetical protein
MNKTLLTNQLLKVLTKENKKITKENYNLFLRVTDDKKIVEEIGIKMPKNTPATNEILDYFDCHSDCKNEKRIFNSIRSEFSYKESLNPNLKTNPYTDYFVDSTKEGDKVEHIKQLDDLLKEDDNGDIDLLKDKNFWLIGNKGSGKTITQNNWLYENRAKLEELGVVWIRLDVSKLIKLWEIPDIEINRHITPEQYFNGQLCYVFSKYFQKRFDTYSKLFATIAEYLLNSDDNNIKEDYATKKEMKHLEGYEKIITLANKRRKVNTIIDYLKYLEEQIAIKEQTNKSDDNRMSPEEKREEGLTTYSFLVDKVFSEYQKKIDSPFFDEFQVLGKFLKDFILKNNYYILYIVDGMDNINFFHTERKKWLKNIIQLVYNFPIKGICRSNELLLISVRYTKRKIMQY